MSVDKVTVLDVASYILRQSGQMSTMKLQKLVYYSQAWSLVWDDEPLFNERIEAWANGPVCPALFHEHKGCFEAPISLASQGDTSKLSQYNIDTINVVLESYGDLTGSQLSILSHREDPWQQARKGIREFVPCNNEITQSSMADYFTQELSSNI